MEKYLTETQLGFILQRLYPTGNWINNKSVPGSGLLTRPDFRSETLKIIVEFDGYHHYNSINRIISDKQKDFVYKNMGYKIIHIPYFVQMSTEIIKILFDLDVNFPQQYPHGFIDDKVLLPADFNDYGTKRFINDLETIFKPIKNEIIKSLEIKISKVNITDSIISTDILERIKNIE